MKSESCRYCGSEMTEVVWGAKEELQLATDSIDYRLEPKRPDSEDWICNNCDARIVKEFTSESGLCLMEAPKQVVNAVAVFCDILADFLEPFKGTDDPTGVFEGDFREKQVELGCQNDEYSAEELDGADDPVGQFQYLHALDHRNHGDSIDVRVCGHTTLRVFFDGTVRAYSITYEGGYGPFPDQETFTVRESSVESIRNPHQKVSEWILGEPLYDVVHAIGTAYCNEYLCEHEDAKNQNRRRFQLDDMIYSLEYMTESRLSKDYPSVRGTASHHSRLK